jgi:general stress protein YciG
MEVIPLPNREEDTKRGKMSVAEAGKKGGQRTSETHGEEFYSEIGSKGGSQRAKQHEGSPEAKGKTSLEEAGHKGGQRVRKLIQEGKEHEQKK